ncbi:MAG: RHS repeat protein [Deltaproteobacteria bacterium]|nr:RHS repeat protein [Deltaproteobacteria bacterium]
MLKKHAPALTLATLSAATILVVALGFGCGGSGRTDRPPNASPDATSGDGGTADVAQPDATANTDAAPNTDAASSADAALDTDAASNADAGLKADAGEGSADPWLDDSQPPTPVDLSGAFDFYDSTRFLYEGDNPIQTGVASGAIKPDQIAVLRGKVTDREGTPMAQVEVTVLDQADYGASRTKSDGVFEVAVNGGRQVSVTLKKAGYLSVQRSITPKRLDWTWVPDVVMTPLDAKVTEVPLSTLSEPVFAEGSPVVDEDGTRTARVLFQPGVIAEMVMPDGTRTSLPSLHVRATEYTVGPTGPSAMPGILPRTSMYTYAVELSVDEAETAGATSVVFSEPVPLFVDNFLGVATGSIVPVGVYDRTCACWLPIENGLVISVLAIEAGSAVLDVTGSGVAANASELATLGISDTERRAIAERFAVGQSFWRSPLPHFSPIDCNFPGGPDCDLGAACEPLVDVEPEEVTEDPCEGSGSIIQCENQALAEAIPLRGTPYALHYVSARSLANQATRRLSLAITRDEISPKLKRVLVTTDIAGQRIETRYDPRPKLQHRIEWNGKDAWGRSLKSSSAVVEIGYVYPVAYTTAAQLLTGAFMARGETFRLDVDRARGEFTVFKRLEIPQERLRYPRPPPAGLGGWSLNVHHEFDRGLAWLGTGENTRVSQVQRLSPYYDADTLAVTPPLPPPPRGAAGTVPFNAVFGPDGAMYWWHRRGPCSSLLRVNPERTEVTHVLGRLDSQYGELGLVPVTVDQPEDGEDAKASCLSQPTMPSFDARGRLHFSLPYLGKVFRFEAAEGTLSLVAGNGSCENNEYAKCDPGTFVEGGKATERALGRVGRPVFSSSCAMYLPSDGCQVLEVSPSGDVSGFFGLKPGTKLDTQPASCEQMRFYSSDTSLPLLGAVGVDSKDDVFVLQGKTVRFTGGGYKDAFCGTSVLRVDQSGRVEPIAGAGMELAGPGDFAMDAQFACLTNLLVGSRDSLHLSEHRIDTPGPRELLWRVEPEGYLSLLHVSRGGDPLFWATYLLGPDETAYHFKFGDTMRLDAPLHNRWVSPDGLWVAESDARGRHIRTTNAISGVVHTSFAYDAANRLSTVVDRLGRSVVIERDAVGTPTAIVAPTGERTELSVNNEGLLASVVEPGGGRYEMTYDDRRLLSAFRYPEGATSTFEYDDEGRLTKDESSRGRVQTLSRAREDRRTTITLSEGVHARSFVVEAQTGPLREPRVLRKQVLADGSVVEGRSDVNTAGIEVRETKFPSGARRELTMTPDSRWGMDAPYASEIAWVEPTGVRHVQTRNTSASADASDPLKLNAFSRETRLNSQRLMETYSPSTRTETLDFLQLKMRRLTVRDERDNLLSETWRDSQDGVSVQTTSFHYDAEGRLESIDGPRDDVDDIYTFSRDSAGRVSRVVDPVGGAYSFVEREPGGRITHLTASNGADVKISYAPGGRVASFDRNGRISRMGIDPLSFRESFTAANGAEWQVLKDSKGQGIAEFATPVGTRMRRTHDPARGEMLVELIDSSGVVRGSQSSSFDRATSTLMTTIGGVPVVSTLHPVFGKPLSISRDGRTRYFSYDPERRVTRIVEASGAATTFTYSLDGSMQRTDPTGLVTQWIRGSMARLATFVSPAAGSLSLTYDAANNLIGHQDARGISATYAYDALNRMTRMATPDDTIEIEYGDAAVGPWRPTRLRNTTGQSVFDYNVHGEPTGRVETIEGVDLSVRYARDSMGAITQTTYPSGLVVNFARDPAGLVRSIDAVLPASEPDSAVAILTEATYLPFGPLTGYMMPSGQRHQRSYDGAYRPIEVLTQGLRRWSYAYDDYGGLASIDENGTREELFEYDDDLRLILAQGPYGEQAFSLSAAGDRRSWADGAAAPVDYEYDATTGRLSTVSSLADPFEYDASGNTTKMGDLVLSYNASGRLTGAEGPFGTATYRFNARGQRVAKTVNGATSLYVYEDGAKLLGEYDEDGSPRREIMWLDTMPVATLEFTAEGWQLQWITTDHRGVPRVLTDIAGEAIWTWTPDPFGRGVPDEDPDADGQRTRFDLRFPGQLFDVETGLHQNYLRTYSPEYGRYLEPDPLAMYGQTQAYTYAAGNPVQGIDWMGLAPVPIAGRAYIPGGPPLPPEVGFMSNHTLDIPSVDSDVISSALSQCGALNDVAVVIAHGDPNGEGLYRNRPETLTVLDKNGVPVEITRHGIPVSPADVVQQLQEFGWDPSMPILVLACHGAVCSIDTMTSQAQEILREANASGGSCDVYASGQAIPAGQPSETPIPRDFGPVTAPPPDLPKSPRDIEWFVRNLPDALDALGRVISNVAANGPSAPGRAPGQVPVVLPGPGGVPIPAP